MPVLRSSVIEPVWDEFAVLIPEHIDTHRLGSNPACAGTTWTAPRRAAALLGARTVVPLPRLPQVEDYLDHVSNRAMPDAGIREALGKCGPPPPSWAPNTTEAQLRTAAEALDCADACGIDLPEAVKQLDEKAFMIVVQDFQDPARSTPSS